VDHEVRFEVAAPIGVRGEVIDGINQVVEIVNGRPATERRRIRYGEP
jgi:hypothetical protein